MIYDNILALNSWTKIGEALFILTFVVLSKSNNDDSKESYFSILMEFLEKIWKHLIKGSYQGKYKYSGRLDNSKDTSVKTYLQFLKSFP